MKKLLALLLALVMILSLAACAEEDDESASRRRKKDTETTSDTTEETEETEPEETKPKEKESRPQIIGAYTVFEEMGTVIIDDEYITLFIGTVESDNFGLYCELELENNADRNIALAAQCVAVNGKMTTDSLYVEAEKNDDGTEEFVISELQHANELTRLTMLLTVYDTEEYEFSPNYMIDIYPQGIDAYEEPDIDRSGDTVMVDQYDIYAVTKSCGENEWGEYVIDFLAVNDTDMHLTMELDTESINNFGFEDSGAWDILPGTYAEEQFILAQYESLKELGMGPVTELVMQLNVTDEEYDEIFSDPVKLYPEGKGKTETFIYEYENDDVVIAEGDDFKLTLAKTVTNEWGDTKVIFVVENKHDNTLCIEGTNVKINGKTVEGLDLFSYYTGSKDHHAVMNIYDFYLEDAKISTIETIEMELVIENEEFEIIFEETVAFNIP